MKILGIDTSTKFLALGIYGQNKVYDYNLEVGIRLSSLITLTIKRVLEALDWRASDIDYFACGLGPGSFTGIRVGVATVKGLSWSLGKPVIGISTLDILAKNACPVRSNSPEENAAPLARTSNGVKDADAYIVPMVDAKRNLIYSSVYKIKKSLLKRIAPYMLLSEDEFFRKIKSITDSSSNKKEVKILGDGINLYKQKILINIRGAAILDREYWYPKGRNIIDLALERIRSKKVNSPFEIKPIYLYPKECQIRNADSRG